MTEKRKMESSEQANNCKREKLLKKLQKSENWRHLNNIKKGLRK